MSAAPLSPGDVLARLQVAHAHLVSTPLIVALAAMIGGGACNGTTDPTSRAALPTAAWSLTGSPSDLYAVVGAIDQSLIVTTTQGARAINLGGSAPLGGAPGTTRWTTVDPVAPFTWRGELVPAGGSRVIVGGPTAIAFDLADGSVAWTFGSVGLGQSYVASSNRLFVSTAQYGASTVSAVDSSGQQRWSVPYDTLCAPSCQLYGLAVSGDTVFAPGAASDASNHLRSFLLALNATTGARLSTFTNVTVDDALGSDSPPRVFGRLLILTGLFKAVAIDRTTGTVVWRQTLPTITHIPFAPTLLVGNRLILPRDSSIMALDAATGAIQWESRFSLRGAGFAACPSHLVVVGPQSLFAVNTATGQWTHGGQSNPLLPSYTSIAGDGTHVYVSTNAASVVQAIPCP